MSLLSADAHVDNVDCVVITVDNCFVFVVSSDEGIVDALSRLSDDVIVDDVVEVKEDVSVLSTDAVLIEVVVSGPVDIKCVDVAVVGSTITS